jgi:lipopolysaccharide transport system ATP-binding protein
VTWPTTGRIEIFGRVSALLEVGTGFHLELSGRENIFLSGAIHGMKKSEVIKYFDEIVEFSGVEKFLDTPVKRYSSGMFLRLAFSVMTYLKSDILIVDEILAVGDAQFQEKCLNKMRAIAKEGRTILFVSHQFDKVRFLCEQALWIKEGELFDQGPTADVLSRYEEFFR